MKLNSDVVKRTRENQDAPQFYLRLSQHVPDSTLAGPLGIEDGPSWKLDASRSLPRTL